MQLKKSLYNSLTLVVDFFLLKNAKNGVHNKHISHFREFFHHSSGNISGSPNYTYFQFLKLFAFCK